MNKRVNVQIAVVLVAYVLMAFTARGDALVAINDWDPGPHAWTNLPYGSGWANLDIPATGGSTGGWLRITFPETFESELEEQEWSDTIYTPVENLWSGTWVTNMVVQFDFWYSNTAPEYIQVRWADSDTNRVWRSTVFDSDTDSMSETNWTTITSPFMSDSELWGGGAIGTQAQFLQDLDSIDWIGLYIWRGSADESIYGIDDFKLLVPEPTEYMMLAAALLTILASVRSSRFREIATPVHTRY